MQFIHFYIFTLICSYSLAISVLTKQNLHEKASAVANRLLKELANETLAKQALNEESQQDEIEYVPVIEEFYPIEEESSSSSEINDLDDIFPLYDQELIRYSKDEEDESNENLIRVIHTRIPDDNTIEGDDH